MDAIKIKANITNSLQYLVVCLFEKLNSEQQMVAKYASIIGHEFNDTVLRAVLPSKPLSVLKEILEGSFVRTCMCKSCDFDCLFFICETSQYLCLSVCLSVCLFVCVSVLVCLSQSRPTPILIHSTPPNCPAPSFSLNPHPYPTHPLSTHHLSPSPQL